MEYSNGTRDIHFKKNDRNVWITDQKSCFAIYALAEESEKDFYLKTFNEFNPIPDSVKRNPEPASPKNVALDTNILMMIMLLCLQ